MSGTTPRITPLEPPFTPEQTAALEQLGPPIALFRVLARRPELAAGVAGWGSYYLSRRSALTLRQRELVIDRTCVRLGAGYEWGVHVAVFSGKAGLDDAQLASLAGGSSDDACWDPADSAVLAAVDELVDRNDLTDQAWDALVAAAGEEGALDVVLVCGWYHAIGFLVRALRLAPEPSTPPLPPDAAVTVIAHYRTRPEAVEEVRELLAMHSGASEAEPGCRHFQAHQDAQDPTRFALHEVYDTPEAFAVHRDSPHFRANIEHRLVPLLEERHWRVYGPALREESPQT